MINKIQAYYFFTLIFVLLTSIPAISSEQDIEGWSAEVIKDDSIYLSVPGQVVHGDKLFMHIPRNNCEYARANAFLYTMQRVEGMEKALEGRYLDATFMGDKVKLKIAYVFPAMLGHIALIDMSVVNLDEIEKMLLKKEQITISYDRLDGLEIEKYFDIRENIWTTHNLSHAFLDAKLLCNKL